MPVNFCLFLALSFCQCVAERHVVWKACFSASSESTCAAAELEMMKLIGALEVTVTEAEQQTQSELMQLQQEIYAQHQAHQMQNIDADDHNEL